MAMPSYILNRYLNDANNYNSTTRKRALSTNASVNTDLQSSKTKARELFNITIDMHTLRQNMIKILKTLTERISEEMPQYFSSKEEAINCLLAMECNWMFEYKEFLLSVEKDFKTLYAKYPSEDENLDIEDFQTAVNVGSPLVDDNEIEFSDNLIQSMLAHLNNGATSPVNRKNCPTAEVIDQSVCNSDAFKASTIDMNESSVESLPTIKLQPLEEQLVASKSMLSLKRTHVSDDDKKIETFLGLLNEENDVDILDGVPENTSNFSDSSISLHLSSNSSIIIPQSSVIKMTYEDSQKNKYTVSKHYVQTDDCFVLIPNAERLLVDNKRKAKEHSQTDKSDASSSEVVLRKVSPAKRRKLLSTSTSSSSSSSSYVSPESAQSSDETDSYSSINQRNTFSNSSRSSYSSDFSVVSSSNSSNDVLGGIPDVFSSDSSSESEHKITPVKKKRIRVLRSDDEGGEPDETTSLKNESDTDLDDNWRNDPLLAPLQLDSDVDDDDTEKVNSPGDNNNDKDESNSEEKEDKPFQTTPIKKLRLKKPVVVNDDSDDSVALWPIFSNTFSNVPKVEETSDGSDVEFISSAPRQDGDTPLKKGRRNIKEILSEEELNVDTRKAHEEEKKRIERLEAKQLHSQSQIFSQESLDSDFILDANPDEPISVHAKLAEMLLPHQRQGVQFLWDNCYESVERIQDGDLGAGCILAHCMGLGKTLQVVTLVHTLFKHPVTKTRKVLVISPVSVIPNWRKEFRKANKVVANVKYQVSVFGSVNIETWYRRGGVMIIGYHSFLAIIKKGVTTLNACLMDPGADLVVCDEGHLLKSVMTNRTKIISQVKTKRRIILTGTPMQNNLDEYYYMVGFVKPAYLGTQKEYRNRFVNPIQNGQFEDSVYTDIQIMKKRSHILHKITRSFIQRFEESELSQHLPTKYDYALKIDINETQRKLLTTFLSLCNFRNLFANLNIIRDIISHPHLLKMRLQNLENQNRKDATKDNTHEILQQDGIRPDWFKDDSPADSATNIALGNKMVLMIAIVQQTISRKEKLLIFSSSLPKLDLIEQFLKQTDSKWTRGRTYYRMDGSVSSDKREKYCSDFNSPTSGILLMLLTPRVGGLGLNLHAANRAILMDISWNPADDSQSVFRIYRLGQKKTCFIYRFIGMGTMEEVIYERSVTKQAISRRVVDEQQIMRHFHSSDLESLYRNIRPAAGATRPMHKRPKDEILAGLLQDYKFICSYQDHRELLQNRPDEGLDEAEIKLAWEEYENEKNAPVLNPPLAALPLPNGPPLQRTPNTLGTIPRPSTSYNPGTSGITAHDYNPVMAAQRLGMTTTTKQTSIATNVSTATTSTSETVIRKPMVSNLPAANTSTSAIVKQKPMVSSLPTASSSTSGAVIRQPVVSNLPTVSTSVSGNATQKPIVPNLPITSPLSSVVNSSSAIGKTTTSAPHTPTSKLNALSTPRRPFIPLRSEYTQHVENTLHQLVHSASPKHHLDGKLILYESPAAQKGMIRATFDADGHPTNSMERDSLTAYQLATAGALRNKTAQELRAKLLVITRNGLLQELDSTTDSPFRPAAQPNQKLIFEQIDLIDDD